MRQFWLVAVLAAVVGCKDSSVKVPAGRLNDDQQRRVAAHILAQAPAPAFPVGATFGGGKIRLVGTDVRPSPASRGQTVRVTHYFEAVQPVEQSWKLFVHVQDANAPGILVNSDHFPVEEMYTTEKWKPGQVVEDSYTLTVPSNAPNELVGYIGFYRYDDRLPVDQREKHDGGNRVLAFRIPVSGDQPGLPTYKAPKLKAAITIDGDLSDPGWKDVPSTGAFVRTGDGGPAKYKTEARVAWDEQALYVSFDAEDEDVWGKFEKNDEPIYSEECVEVFVDADGDGKTYNEMQVSPRNVQFDAYFPARRTGMDLAWSAGMTTAVKVRGTLNDPSDKDQGWSAEFRIPVANLAKVPHWPPEPGDKWRFDLYRLEWHSDRKVNEGSAFSPPLVGDFHNLPRFGVLEFGG